MLYFQERLFGVYVCYALYNLQPVDHVCQVINSKFNLVLKNLIQIPVTAVQFEELLEFQKSLEVEKLLEPIAALKMLILKKAFRIKVFQSTYDPATHKKYLAEEELPYFNKIPVVSKLNYWNFFINSFRSRFPVLRKCSVLIL